MPHNAVFQKSSLNTKLRSISLSMSLKTGLLLKQDILSIITRLGSHPIHFNSIRSENLQRVSVDKDHERYQQLLHWVNENDNFSDTIVTNVVTPIFYLAERFLRWRYSHRRRYTYRSTKTKKWVNWNYWSRRFFLEKMNFERFKPNSSITDWNS